MAGPLDGRVAIVTGGGGGIGQAYALGLAEAGAAVVIADINTEAAEAAAGVLTGAGHRSIGVRLDVTDTASAAAMVEAVRAEYGRIDILVNNAAMMSEIPKDPLLTLDIGVWERVMRVNVTGPLICTQAVVPSMLEVGAGRIVNQSSAAAFLPGGLYRISKHSLVGLTAGLAAELGPKNISVNAIAPGLIETEAGFRSAGGPGTEKRTSRYSAVPHARPDRPPKDLVGTLLLLTTDAGDFINGQTINVDGGWVMRL